MRRVLIADREFHAPVAAAMQRLETLQQLERSPRGHD